MVSTVTPPAEAALRALIDYAGLFPPAALSMDEARADYVACSGSSQAWMVGRFVVPLSRLAELQADMTGRPFAVSAILDGGTEPLRWFADAVSLLERALPNVDSTLVLIESVEIALPKLTSAREAYGSAIGQLAALLTRFDLGHVPAYVELPRDERLAGAIDQAMTSLARHGLRAKVRCGGIISQAFPSTAELAAFVVAATRESVAFRATAGLHHPVRKYDATVGCTMHGFLNVLGATLVAMREGDPVAVQTVLEEEDAAAFVFDADGLQVADHHFTLSEIVAMRERGFVAYGSCSVSEPIEDLTALGILP